MPMSAGDESFRDLLRRRRKERRISFSGLSATMSALGVPISAGVLCELLSGKREASRAQLEQIDKSLDWAARDTMPSEIQLPANVTALDILRALALVSNTPRGPRDRGEGDLSRSGLVVSMLKGRVSPDSELMVNGKLADDSEYGKLEKETE